MKLRKNVRPEEGDVEESYIEWDKYCKVNLIKTWKKETHTNTYPETTLHLTFIFLRIKKKKS